MYAVGGNAEAARRAGISVPRIRIIVFMISGFMAGVGGVMLAGNLRSVAPDQGGGTLLLDAISAAVIGGTSLFGGRGEVRSAVLGSAVIATIANGLYIFGFQPGVIYITTGCDPALRRHARHDRAPPPGEDRPVTRLALCDEDRVRRRRELLHGAVRPAHDQLAPASRSRSRSARADPPTRGSSAGVHLLRSDGRRSCRPR